MRKRRDCDGRTRIALSVKQRTLDQLPAFRKGKRLIIAAELQEGMRLDNYVAVLHDCGSVSADDYYLAWKAVTDNTHPMIRTIKVLEVST